MRRQIGERRLRLTDDDRRKLAARAYRLGRQALREVATIVTPDTLLRWHRQLVPHKYVNVSVGCSTTTRELHETVPLVRLGAGTGHYAVRTAKRIRDRGMSQDPTQSRRPRN